MLLTSGIDASENSRSLSNDSLNPRPYTYNLVNVHLTKLMTGIGSNFMVSIITVKIVLFATIFWFWEIVVFSTIL